MIRTVHNKSKYRRHKNYVKYYSYTCDFLGAYVLAILSSEAAGNEFMHIPTSNTDYTTAVNEFFQVTYQYDPGNILAFVPP